MQLAQTDGQIIGEAELLDNTWDTLVDMRSMTDNILDKDKVMSAKKLKEEEEKKKEEKKAKDEESEKKAIQEARDEILK